MHEVSVKHDCIMICIQWDNYVSDNDVILLKVCILITTHCRLNREWLNIVQGATVTG